MKKYLFIISVFFLSFELSAQTVKPDVFVIGNGNAAVAAAIQAAQSNVKTVLLLQAGGFDIEPIGKDLHSGVQAAFLNKIKKFKQLNDSIGEVQFDKQTANQVLLQWTDSIKNLTVIKNVQWVKADRSGKGWVFKLSDGKTIRPEIFVNVADQKLNAALKIDASMVGTWQKFSYENPIYKTNIAAGKQINGSTNTIFSLYQLLMPTQENLVYVSDPTSMLMGQAGGAVAAFAGFFDKRTSESNLKKIQGELIAFNSNLMPFVDVGIKDASWKAIQMVGISGVIKAEETNGKLLFNGEKLVSTADIKQVVKDHYYKAQIWFDDYKSDVITIGAALDMICYVGNKAPESTLKEVEKKWKTTYAFTSKFEAERQISRRELAVLLQDYMPPFNVTVDKTGKIIR
ncbi:hypothetical protein [Pedobacter sp.]|uniref:hypothetical protein n=1 Tax=Pedobacter sp. TaxID=1411316 RepID=UPI0031CED705